MRYDLNFNDDIAKDVHSLASFDAEWSGTERTLDRVIVFLQEQVNVIALNVCTDIAAGGEERKAYDRGYVKGLYETMVFLKRAATAGRLIQFPDEKYSETPSKII